ncbi:hypothetical protein F5051DRAFT_433523 [Lentinula edodes]|nr:hypothetical protein F5051DRAFT_433523 [Lentinula edodes]
MAEILEILESEKSQPNCSLEWDSKDWDRSHRKIFQIFPPHTIIAFKLQKSKEWGSDWCGITLETSEENGQKSIKLKQWHKLRFTWLGLEALETKILAMHQKEVFHFLDDNLLSKDQLDHMKEMEDDRLGDSETVNADVGMGHTPNKIELVYLESKGFKMSRDRLEAWDQLQMGWNKCILNESDFK